jgi:hypothetical protein
MSSPSCCPPSPTLGAQRQWVTRMHGSGLTHAPTSRLPSPIPSVSKLSKTRESSQSASRQRLERLAPFPISTRAWWCLLAPGGVVVLTRGCVQDHTPSAPSCTPTPASRATDQGTWGTPARFVARQARRACDWLKPTSARAWVKNSRLFSLDMVQA